MKAWRYTPQMIRRYLEAGHWVKETFPGLWARNAQQFPDKEALVDSRLRLAFAQANVYIDRLALGFLQAGLKRDQVVIVQLPNSVENVLICLALEKAGLLRLALPMVLRQNELEHLAARVEASGLIFLTHDGKHDYIQTSREIAEAVPSLKYLFAVGDGVPSDVHSVAQMMERPLEDDYPANYLSAFTIQANEYWSLAASSGTTGIPKIAAHTTNDLWMITGRDSVERWHLRADDILCPLAPVSGGVGGVGCMGTAPQVAAKLVLLEKFDAEAALQLIEKERVTIAAGVPAQIAMILRHPSFDKYDLSSLHMWVYGGAVCPPSLAQEAEEKMGCRIVAVYGSLDGGGITAGDYEAPPEVRWSSVGRPLPGAEVRLIDERGKAVPTGEVGEVTVRGPSCGPGYFKDNESTLKAWGGKRDGFFRTGDLGRFDRDGFLYVVGRVKDVIIRGGQNIYPAEVEDMLLAHPKIMNATVVAMPDPVMGEKACAFVILRQGQTLTMEEMVDFLRQKKIAAYKLPERLEIVDSFPMAGDGQKVIKRELTRRVEEQLRGTAEDSSKG